MTKWKWLFDETLGWKGHVVPEGLALDLEWDLAQRRDQVTDPIFTLTDHTDEAYFDLPGMMWNGRSDRHLEVDGLKIQIPSQDFFTIYAQLKTLPVRKFKDERPYYKLHGWRYCIILTPAQRQIMITAMAEQADAAEAEAEKDLARFEEAIAQVNAKAGREVLVSQKLKSVDPDNAN
jgi:hypothetical protein